MSKKYVCEYCSKMFDDQTDKIFHESLHGKYDK